MALPKNRQINLKIKGNGREKNNNNKNAHDKEEGIRYG